MTAGVSDSLLQHVCSGQVRVYAAPKHQLLCIMKCRRSLSRAHQLRGEDGRQVLTRNAPMFPNRAIFRTVIVSNPNTEPMPTLMPVIRERRSQCVPVSLVWLGLRGSLLACSATSPPRPLHHAWPLAGEARARASRPALGLRAR
eukprot:4804609-Pyramimonas_sp.AAC.1